MTKLFSLRFKCTGCPEVHVFTAELVDVLCAAQRVMTHEPNPITEVLIEDATEAEMRRLDETEPSGFFVSFPSFNKG